MLQKSLETTTNLKSTVDIEKSKEASIIYQKAGLILKTNLSNLSIEIKKPPRSTSTNPTDDNAANETTIVYSDSGFFPKEVTVKKGSMVTFKNESLLKMWPASAKHPTHEVYPGSSITKCNTPAASAIFDACKGISRSESWSFTFNEAGSWAYHDHLKPTYFGKIIVE